MFYFQVTLFRNKWKFWSFYMVTTAYSGNNITLKRIFLSIFPYLTVRYEKTNKIFDFVNNFVIAMIILYSLILNLVSIQSYLEK